MPAYALQLLIAALLVALTFVVSYPFEIGGTRQIDVLDTFLLMFSLVNLRLAWNAANTLGGGRAPGWFVVAGLLLAALIAYGMIQALTPR